MVKGADLQVPGVADDRELEEALEVLAGDEVLRDDSARVTRRLGRDAVIGEPREVVGQELRDAVWVPSSELL